MVKPPVVRSHRRSMWNGIAATVVVVVLCLVGSGLVLFWSGAMDR